jgi:hypothetical protein
MAVLMQTEVKAVAEVMPGGREEGGMVRNCGG